MRNVREMFEERLLERIGNLERNPEDRTATDVSRATRSIISHLQRMLNTRQGSVQIDEDYGIPDITNFPGEDFSDTGHGMSSLINQFIIKYEPRLDQVHIIFEPQEHDVLSLRFRLEGILVRGNKMPVTFETWVDSSGKVNVRD